MSAPLKLSSVRTATALGLVYLAATMPLRAFAQAPSALPPPATPPPSFRRIPTITAEDLKAQFPLNAQGAHEMEIPQIVNTCEDKEVRAILSGSQVETIGEIVPQHDSNAPGERLRVARSQMQCCAAHSRNYSIVAAFSDRKPDLKEGCWVRLIGFIHYEAEGEKVFPVLAVKSIVEVPVPISPLLK
jgi:hypothetical protein